MGISANRRCMAVVERAGSSMPAYANNAAAVDVGATSSNASKPPKSFKLAFISKRIDAGIRGVTHEE